MSRRVADIYERVPVQTGKAGFSGKISFNGKSMKTIKIEVFCEYLGSTILICINIIFLIRKCKTTIYWTPEENLTRIPCQLPELIKLEDRSGGTMRCRVALRKAEDFFANDWSNSQKNMFPET